MLLCRWFRLLLPKVKYCLSWSRMARAIHRSLLIWPSSVILLCKKGVWDVAVRCGPMTVPIICMWLAFALLYSFGFARIIRTFVLIKAVLLDYDFTLCWLQTLRWFTSRTTKVTCVFTKLGVLCLFSLLERLSTLSMVSSQGIFNENLIKSTQWRENQPWNKMALVQILVPPLGWMRWGK